jgi:hypothetical protein
MVDKETIIELAPHYVAMLILVTIALTILRNAVENLGFWVELVVIVVVVFLYPFVVRRLGYEPSAWADR